MGAQADRIFTVLAERGYPDPWAAFGDHLSWESAHSVQLKTAIDTYRKEPAETAHEKIEQLFALKAANLTAAADLLAKALVEYDVSGMWAVLDERATRLDIDDLSERWARGIVEHPFPIALRSLQFNWGYMKEHGVRAFYEMTSHYIAGLTTSNTHWHDAWTTELTTGNIDRITTIECDLTSEEAPMHCDICQKTITVLLYLDE
jgi:hypothetical protein